MPSGLNATLVTGPVWPVSGRRGAGRCRRPTAAPSCPQLPEAMRLPSGLNATLVTAAVWPLRVADGWPVSASHSRTVLSSAAGGEALAVGAERHAGHRRVAVERAPIGWPVAASHSRTVLSPLPEASRVPVGAERHADHRARCGR